MTSLRQLTCNPVGRIHSCFTQALGTPIQPRFAGGCSGTAEIFLEYAEGLHNLEGFSRVWLLFWCDRAIPAKMKVIPYRDTEERGLFSTRAPARPNPIGLSCVRLTGITGNILHLEEVDILDGTPLLDIKPYVPEYDAYPVENTGWIGEQGLKVVSADGRFEQALAPSRNNVMQEAREFCTHPRRDDEADPQRSVTEE